MLDTQNLVIVTNRKKCSLRNLVTLVNLNLFLMKIMIVTLTGKILNVKHHCTVTYNFLLQLLQFYPVHFLIKQVNIGFLV